MSSAMLDFHEDDIRNGTIMTVKLKLVHFLAGPSIDLRSIAPVVVW